MKKICLTDIIKQTSASQAITLQKVLIKMINNVDANNIDEILGNLSDGLETKILNEVPTNMLINLIHFLSEGGEEVDPIHIGYDNNYITMANIKSGIKKASKKDLCSTFEGLEDALFN